MFADTKKVIVIVGGGLAAANFEDIVNDNSIDIPSTWKNISSGVKKASSSQTDPILINDKSIQSYHLVEQEVIFSHIFKTINQVTILLSLIAIKFQFYYLMNMGL